MFTDGPDKGAVSGAIIGAGVGGAIGLWGPRLPDPGFRGRIRSCERRILVRASSEYIGNKVKDKINEKNKQTLTLMCLSILYITLCCLIFLLISDAVIDLLFSGELEMNRTTFKRIIVMS
ncbi:hypothetical protein WDV93_20700 [Pantoea ananatis]